MKKTARGKSQLDKIRSAIKIRWNEQKEKEKHIKGKYFKKAKSLSPLNNHLELEKSDSFDIKNYMNDRFDNIDDDIQEMKGDINQIKGDINQMKVTINQMELNSKYSMLMTGLNKGLFVNEYKVRKKIGKYINGVFNSIYKDIPINKEEKDNTRNKNSSSLKSKFNATLPENLINLNKSTNILNVPKKIYSSVEKRINLKKGKANKSKSLSVTLNAHSHRQSIKSAYSINNKIINLKKRNFRRKNLLKFNIWIICSIISKKRSQKYQQTKISTLTTSLIKNIKIKVMFLIIVNTKIARVAVKAIRLNQIILLILTPVKKMVKNDCVFFSFEPKFKYNLKY